MCNLKSIRREVQRAVHFFPIRLTTNRHRNEVLISEKYQCRRYLIYLRVGFLN